MGTRAKDLSEKIFGKLSVIKRIENASNGDAQWLCQCECGKIISRRASSLMNGTKSCGCMQIEMMKRTKRTHGHTIDDETSPEYYTWLSMIARCTNPNHPQYKNWGGRGIQICKEWLESFENFFRDMGERPKGKTLDRYPNKDGNYFKENCRWATPKQQANNKTNNVILTFNGKQMTRAEFADLIGVNYFVVRDYLIKHTTEEAFKHYCCAAGG